MLGFRNASSGPKCGQIYFEHFCFSFRDNVYFSTDSSVSKCTVHCNTEKSHQCCAVSHTQVWPHGALGSCEQGIRGLFPSQSCSPLINVTYIKRCAVILHCHPVIYCSLYQILKKGAFLDWGCVLLYHGLGMHKTYFHFHDIPSQR